ncbi:MAG: MBOAT family protein [Myxococcales bacterium]|nr:MBOAT family protein [Myxococcales bacterium]
MIFTSPQFAVFFVLFFWLWIALRGRGDARKWLLLAASYLFYGSWNAKFLLLILGSTAVDFYVGRALAATEDARRRKRLLWVSVGVNLGALGFFKYFDFFVKSAVDALAALGVEAHLPTLQILLPVGISFYTFQTMSYTIDIYRREMAPTRRFLDFALYVAFFPQLVAGPIERASHFLPQVAKPRTITSGQIEAGVWLIVWGLFKKVVIADNVAGVANTVFNGYTHYEGLDLLIGALAFTVQIYGDFSGYSDIARGLAKLMGFELMVNFALPYFSRTPSEFWRRWHISLSSWLRDYLYISLGGNRGGSLMTYRNLALTMLLGGLWHGAAWNFVLWGAFHGLILCVYRPFELRKRADAAPLPMPLRVAKAFAMWFVFFVLTVIGWVLFRAESVPQIEHFLTHMWSFETSAMTADLATTVGWCALPLFVAQVAQYARHDLLAPVRGPWIWRAALCAVLAAALPLFAPGESVEFIYFQF